MPNLLILAHWFWDYVNLTLECSINTKWVVKMWWTTSSGSSISCYRRIYSHCIIPVYHFTRERGSVYTCHAENLPHYNISDNVILPCKCVIF